MKLKKSGSAPFIYSRYTLRKTYDLETEVFPGKVGMQSDKLKVRLIGSQNIIAIVIMVLLLVKLITLLLNQPVLNLYISY